MGRATSRNPVARAVGGRLFSTIGGKLLQKQQLARRDQFEETGASSGRIVFLGDSISEFGNWSEWFPQSPVLNRGVGGEVSAQVLDRLDSAVHEPLGVLLLVGTNDLAAGIDEPRIVENVRQILIAIERVSPGSHVIVQSVMPRSLEYRDEVLSLNKQYRRLVEVAGPQVRYLDLWPALATPEGRLRPDYTRDQLHLNGQGYRAWTQVLAPLIKELTSAGS